MIKWMPSCWYNKALATPTLTLPGTLFSTFWLFIENNSLYDVIWDFKREKKVCQKAFFHGTKTTARTLPSAPPELMIQSHFL